MVSIKTEKLKQKRGNDVEENPNQSANGTGEIKQLLDPKSYIAGLQWFFFIFTNIVVIPLSVGAAFQMSQGEIAAFMQRSFIFTGAACIIQALWGHRLPLMEGQTGLWWGVILNICASAAVTQIPLSELGGSLAVGIVISGIIVMILGALGLLQKTIKLFNPVVMSVFLFLLSAQLITIFFKGMLGLSTVSGETNLINVPVSILSISIAVLAAVLTIKGKNNVSRFALLISIIIGWIIYQIIFPGAEISMGQQDALLRLYPWGKPAWHPGIILTTIITGFLSLSNTIAALKGGESTLGVKVTTGRYKISFVMNGIFSVVSGLFGLVPYSPYVSSLGFLEATRIYQRLPLIIGAALFMILGIIPPLARLFATLPLSIGNAVLFVAYLQLFGTALRQIKNLDFDQKTIYRIAAPTLLGIALMTFQYEVFLSLPVLLQPLVSNGLIVGMVLSLVLENCINWQTP